MAQQIDDRPLTHVTAADARGGSTFLRAAGYCGLVASLAFLTTGVMSSVAAVPPPTGPGDIAAHLQDVAQLGWPAAVYGVAGIALVVAYLPMAVGIHALLGRTPTAWFGTAAVIVGLAVLVPAYVVSLLTPAGLAPAAAEVGVAGAEALYVTYASAGAVASVCFAVGSALSLGIGPLLWGVEWVRSRDTGRWLGWAAVVVGVTGVAWLSLDLDGPVLPLVVALNALVALVVFSGMSVVLVAAGRPARSA